MSQDVFRSGFACLVGRPNAGKSTLTNAMVGRKIAITSDRPQTTRRVLRGIVNRPEGQLVLVDTPGLHRPRTLLGRRPIVAVVTKTDTVGRDVVAERLLQVAALGEEIGLGWAEVVPVSARVGENVEVLIERLIAHLPEGPVLFPEGEDDATTDEIAVAELIREAALEGVQDELPHSIAVVVEEIVPRIDRPADRPLTDVRANLFVERETQKAIVIGKGGARLKQVGTRARREIEVLLGTPVFLDIRVKVAKDWQKDPKQLRRLGF